MESKNGNYRKRVLIILALDITAKDSNHQVIIISIIIVITDNKRALAANRMPGSARERIRLRSCSAGSQQMIIAIENHMNSNSIFYLKNNIVSLLSLGFLPPSRILTLRMMVPGP